MSTVKTNGKQISVKRRYKEELNGNFKTDYNT